MEIATRNGIIPGSVGLAQAHPLTKTPAMREQPSAGLCPVAVHPTNSGVGPREWSLELSNFPGKFEISRGNLGQHRLKNSQADLGLDAA